MLVCEMVEKQREQAVISDVYVLFLKLALAVGE